MKTYTETTPNWLADENIDREVRLAEQVRVLRTREAQLQRKANHLQRRINEAMAEYEQVQIELDETSSLRLESEEEILDIREGVNDGGRG